MLLVRMNRLRHLCSLTITTAKVLRSTSVFPASRIQFTQNFTLNKMSSGDACQMRSQSTGRDDASKIVTYEDILTYKDKQNDVLLVDVREPAELKETGVLPASINIPLGELNQALQNTSASEFKSKYGRDLPDKNVELVFSCKMGGRAKKAMEAAVQMGFQNSKYYKGSWTDYASRQ